MPDNIGVAIIGATGLAGTGHLAGYEAVPGAEVRVLWDRDPDRARAPSGGARDSARMSRSLERIR